MFIRYESPRQFFRFYPITSIIAGLITLLFLLEFLPFNLLNKYQWIFNEYLIIQKGEWWRMFTSMFFHGGITHFLFNTLALIILGPSLERHFRTVKYLLFYLTAGLIGNIGTIIFLPENVYSLGASGAIYGLLGLYITMIWIQPYAIPSVDSQVVIGYVVIGFITSFILPNINIYSHLFGFIAGALIGFFVWKKPSDWFRQIRFRYRSRSMYRKY